MGGLDQILQQEVQKYAGGGTGANLRLYFLQNSQEQVYAVNAFDFPVRRGLAGVVVLARMMGETIVIEEDATDKPLVDALLQRGVPRDKIVLAYAGEPRPDPTPDA